MERKNIKVTIENLDEIIKINEKEENNKISECELCGWVRTVRTSSSSQTFCEINDGSTCKNMQLILNEKGLDKEKINEFNKNTQTGCFIKVFGDIVKSPAKGQKYEMIVKKYEINKHVDDKYPLAKSKMNLDTLRIHMHFRQRTNTFGSVLRIRSKLMKLIHDFYEENNFHHIDPNIITKNECEGGAGVFQLTEKDISKKSNLEYDKNDNYIWNKDHFMNPTYLTVSSQLQLEIFACGLGNVYTTNKSFRSEHSLTNKHCSEFTHLEIEMINIKIEDLMNIAEATIKYCIKNILIKCDDDITNLDNFISKGLKERLNNILNKEFIKKTQNEIIQEINDDIKKLKIKDLDFLEDGSDLGSKHEDYITKKYDTGVFCTNWEFKIKSFYMKKCNDNKCCEAFDLLMPYGIGELVGGSMREEDYDKLIENMKEKNINENSMKFYTDLRKYGTCIHGGFGLGFDRLLMMMTGMKNIRDVIPIPVSYKSCDY